jgi:hypothetical protein
MLFQLDELGFAKRSPVAERKKTNNAPLGPRILFRFCGLPF